MDAYSIITTASNQVDSRACQSQIRLWGEVKIIHRLPLRGRGDRDRCEFRGLLRAGGCIDLGRFRRVSTCIGEADVKRPLQERRPVKGCFDRAR